MTFSEGDRVCFIESTVIGGTVTASRDPLIPGAIGVLWDTGAFGFVRQSRLQLLGTIPGLSEADRASLATAHRMAMDAVAKITGQNRTETGTDVVEHCRECKDELPFMAPSVRADFILWGRFFPPEALGPRCYDHAESHLGHAAMSRIDQYAVFDLRPLGASRG